VNKRLDGPSGEDICLAPCGRVDQRFYIYITSKSIAQLKLIKSFANEISVTSLEKYGGNMHVIHVNG
jgi:hypothetical protein